MPVVVREAIFLGNFADADTDEGTFFIEDNSVYLGVFGSIGNPLWADELLISYDDANSNGQILTDNNASAENISYDLGAGTVTTEVDSLAVVELTVTYTDGTSQSYTNAVMYQDAAGNLFLTNSNFAGTDLNSGSSAAIRSIDVTSITNSNYTGLFQNALQDFVCFAAGTSIRTENGDQAVETLKVGDLVETLDAGLQPVRWIGVNRVEVTKQLAPVRIRAGALGPNFPDRDLVVSQQHRMLIRSKVVPRMFNASEVLVAAKNLLDLDGVELDTSITHITYVHFLFDKHQIVFANNALSESLLPGPQALEMMGQDARAEVLVIFPDLEVLDPELETARPIPAGHKQRRLAQRHNKNGKASFDPTPFDLDHTRNFMVPNASHPPRTYLH